MSEGLSKDVKNMKYIRNISQKGLDYFGSMCYIKTVCEKTTENPKNYAYCLRLQVVRTLYGR